MNIDYLLQEARGIWTSKMTEQEISVAMGVVYGDICRYVRDHNEGKDVDEAELKKELGNIISSTIRWCDDLGFDPKECLKLSVEAQNRYQKKN